MSLACSSGWAKFRHHKCHMNMAKDRPMKHRSQHGPSSLTTNWDDDVSMQVSPKTKAKRQDRHGRPKTDDIVRTRQDDACFQYTAREAKFVPCCDHSRLIAEVVRLFLGEGDGKVASKSRDGLWVIPIELMSDDERRSSRQTHHSRSPVCQ